MVLWLTVSGHNFLNDLNVVLCLPVSNLPWDNVLMNDSRTF